MASSLRALLVVLAARTTVQSCLRSDVTSRNLSPARQAVHDTTLSRPIASQSSIGLQARSSLAVLAVLRGGSSSLVLRFAGLLCAPCLLIIAVFLQPFVVFTRPPSAKTSAELWSTLRENLYNAEADNMHLTKVDGAAAAHSPIAREEAARKLIVNHESVLRDVTNGNALTQPDLARLPSIAEPFVDQALREVARRLIGRRPGEDCLEKLQPTTAALAAWADTAKYLDSRIQATVQEKPGRPPDMSEQAAAAMRAVLWEVGTGAPSPA